MVEGTSSGEPQRRCFVLCFDGTGNQFRGDSTDSNVLRTFRLLDRSSPSQFSWYNPGLGTYIQSGSVEESSPLSRLRSWYLRKRDLAVGANVGDHVMAGYKFLMRYYTAEDDIYLFGFSRGAYTARFLAEMLDHIGLLSSGNEELERFAWKCFSRWQSRKSGKRDKDTQKTLKLYEFMKAFRETFSRPVRRVRFLGLFDTVNSVPRFEAAWLGSGRFPYSAKTSSKTIRHAVSIDERRAKFRVDLISGKSRQQQDEEDPKRTRRFHRYLSDLPDKLAPQIVAPPENRGFGKSLRTMLIKSPKVSQDEQTSLVVDETNTTQEDERFSNNSQTPRAAGPTIDEGELNTATPIAASAENHTAALDTEESQPRYLRRRFSDLRRAQDILEVWFPGNHGDIGGGWRKHQTETWPLAHQPLVWMIHEAQKSGLQFDPEKVAGLNCTSELLDDNGQPDVVQGGRFQRGLHESSKSGFEHDCLRFKRGASHLSVLGWKVMEYLPFRRMDLQNDGSWKPIRWPLPRGEVRDVPRDAKIHRSVIDRMELDPTYRPGNVIMIGQGGRGKKKAPGHLGMGQWISWKNKGDKVGELFVGKAYADEVGHQEEEVGKQEASRPG